MPVNSTASPRRTRRRPATARFGWQQLRRKTPRALRRLGNALAAMATFGAGLSYYENHPRLAFGFGLTGAIGKFLAELFGEDEPRYDDEHDEQAYESDSPPPPTRHERRRRAGVKAPPADVL